MDLVVTAEVRGSEIAESEPFIEMEKTGLRISLES